MLTILITILMFGLLIFIHELGHFITAKWAKVKVYEFALGMGPRLLKFQGKETMYSIRLFPIGGFVQMDGENGESTEDGSFSTKPKWKRLIILAAGALNNLIFGFLLICLVYGALAGWKAYPTTEIDQFHDDAVSVNAGLKPNDKIHSINGYRIFTYTDISYALTKDGVKPLDFAVIRDGKKTEIKGVTFPKEKSESVGEFYVADFYVKPQEKNILTTISYSFNSTVSLSRSVYSYFGSLFTGKADLNQVSGIVGTTKVMDETISTEKGIDYTALLLMMALISVNLGVVNLLPVPALDGGRIVLLGIEAIFRRKLNPKIEMAINAVGLIVLVILMIIVNVKDIFTFF